MAVYTDVSAEALEVFLTRYPLGRALSFKGIAEGVENSNFLLETEAGRFILTLYERRVKADDLPFFLALMAWLADHGFPSAAPVADRDGALLGELEGRPAAIAAFLPGLSVKTPTRGQCQEAGVGLAWLHDAAEGFPGRRANALGQTSWAPLFAPLADAAEALAPGLARTVARDLSEIEAGWPDGLPEGIVHADYFPDNVFFVDGRFAGAIDFYFAARDMRAYDLAVALNAWAFSPSGAFDPARARALLAGYQSRRPLSPAEREALPVLSRGAAMRFFLTRLNDWGSTPPGSLVRPKDPLEYVRKLDAHRAGLGLERLVGLERLGG
ncbi:MAG: homoserine kinase [Alphaproteobacteria bacterium]|nr:homoserine kinase [Alphaproteobacteria bacterium]